MSSLRRVVVACVSCLLVCLYAEDAAAQEVSPIGAQLHVNTNGSYSATFEVMSYNEPIGDQTADTFVVACTRTSAVTSCSAPGTFIVPRDFEFHPVSIDYSTGSAGSGELRMVLNDQQGNEINSFAYYAITVESPISASVTPDNGSLQTHASVAGTTTFAVQNTGSSETTFTVTADCRGAAFPAQCTVSPTSVTLNANASENVTVSWSTGSYPGTGIIVAYARHSGGIEDSGYVNLTLPLHSQVLPDAATIAVLRDTTNTLLFRVKNTSSESHSYDLEAICPNPEATDCVSPAKVTLPAGDSVFVPVTFRTAGWAALPKVHLQTQYDTGYATAEIPSWSECYNVSPCGVRPDTLRTTPSSTNLQATFSVRNRSSSNERWMLSCSAQSPVSSCSVQEYLDELPNETREVTVTYSTTATSGLGSVMLTATPSYNIVDADDGYYWINNGTANGLIEVFPANIAINGGASQQNTHTFEVSNGTSLQQTVTLTATCAEQATGCAVASSVVVPAGLTTDVPVSFTLGAVGTSGKVTLSAVSGSLGGSGFVRAAALPMSVEILALTGPDTLYAGETSTPSIRITNTSGYAGTWTFKCEGTAFAKCVAPTVTLGAAQDSTVTISITAAATAGTGYVRLVAQGPATDRDSVRLTVLRPASLVALGMPNNDKVVRANCPITTSGPGSAVQCGDLLYVHSFPSYRSLNKERAISLIYNSRTAYPTEHLALDYISLPSDPIPDQLEVKLYYGGTTVLTRYVSASEFSATWAMTHRFVLPVPDSIWTLGTGLHTFKVVVKQYDGGTPIRTDSVFAPMLVVNRRTSPFGDGWYVAGIERLFLNQEGTGAAMIAFADGSSLLFRPGAGSSFVSPLGEYSTLTRLANGRFKRVMQGSFETVWYDSTKGGVVDSITDLNPSRNIARYYWRAGPDGYSPDSIIDAGGKVVKFSHDASGRVTGIHIPGVKTITLTHSTPLGDGRTQLTGVVDPDGFTTSLEYVSTSRATLKASTARGTGRVQYWYDGASGTVDSVSAPAGVNPDPRPTRYRAWQRAGLVTTASSVSSNPAATIVPDSAAFSVNYGRWLNGQWMNNDGGAWFRIHASGAPLDITVAPYQYHTRIVRDSIGQPVHIYRWSGLPGDTLDRWNEVWQTWNSDGNLTRTIQKMANAMWTQPSTFTFDTTRYEYHPTFKTLTKVVFPRESGTIQDSLRIFYNAYGWRDSTLDAAGRRTHFQYWSRGLLRSVHAPHPTTIGSLEPVATTYAYDSIGTWSGTWNLKSITRGASVTQYLYDGSGTHLNGSVDPLNRRVDYVFDDVFRPLTISDASGDGTGTFELSLNPAQIATTTYIYDDAARTRTMIAPTGLKTSWHHDPAGRVAKRCVWNGGTIAGCDSTYYGDGRNPTWVRNRQGDISRQTFNNRGQLAIKTVGAWRGGQWIGDSLAFSYVHEDGLMTRAENRYSTVTFSYDKHGRVTREQQHVAKWTDSTSRTHPIGITVFHEYDKRGRRARSYYAGMQGLSVVGSNSITWNGSGVMIPYDTVTYDYDVRGLLTKITNSYLENTARAGQPRSWTYHFDHKARLDSIRYPMRPWAKTERFAYNALDHLIEHRFATVYPTTETLEPDLIGRVVRVQNGSDNKYGFDGFGRLVQQSGLSTPIRPDSFKYDVLGNRTQQGDFTYAYDPVYKRLTRRTLIGNEFCKMDYAYDADGNLLRTMPADSTVCSDAGWDNVYRPDTMVYDGSGRMVSRVRWLPQSDPSGPMAGGIRTRSGTTRSAAGSSCSRGTMRRTTRGRHTTSGSTTRSSTRPITRRSRSSTRRSSCGCGPS